MLLETDRLFMRPVRATDAPVLYRLHTDALVVNSIMNGRTPSRADSDARLDLYLGEWGRLGFGFWMVYEKQANGDLRFAGRCGLRDFDGNDIELGYCFSEASSGRGLAAEASRAIIAAAFGELGLTRLVAVVRPENHRSQRVMRKLGFTYRGETTHHDTPFYFYDLQANDHSLWLGREGFVPDRDPVSVSP